MSCKESAEPSKRIKVLEVYNTLNDGTGYIKGDLTHYESETYDGELLLEKYYYHPNGETKGKEVYIYEDSSLPIGSTYFGPGNNILSNYRFKYNNGLRESSYGYSGNTEELLRIEKFEYSGQLRTRKSIFNPDQTLSRYFEFEHDQYGNEITMTVYSADSTIIAEERYEITKFNKENEWEEKWGFVNDEPTTYQIIK